MGSEKMSFESRAAAFHHFIDGNTGCIGANDNTWLPVLL